MSVRIMMRAAKSALLPEPDFISEPEAAALQILVERGANKTSDFKVGDIFVVVDAGGGTVVCSHPSLDIVSDFRLRDLSL